MARIWKKAHPKVKPERFCKRPGCGKLITAAYKTVFCSNECNDKFQAKRMWEKQKVDPNYAEYHRQKARLWARTHYVPRPRSRKYMKKGLSIVKKAIEFARAKHGNTLDSDGKNLFMAHPAIVGRLLGFVTNDDNVIAAGYLHDVIEDTGTTYQELVKEFNQDIADLVMEVTQEGSKDRHGYYFPRLHTQRGIMIKFADRLSNLSRLESWNEERIAQYLRKSKFWKTEEQE